MSIFGRFNPAMKSSLKPLIATLAPESKRIGNSFEVIGLIKGGPILPVARILYTFGIGQWLIAGSNTLSWRWLQLTSN